MLEDVNKPKITEVVPLSSEAGETKQKSAGRAIVTYGRSLIALVIARSLHEKGVEVIGCDDVGMTVLSFSKHVKENFVHASLEKDEEKALNDLEEAVRKYAPDDDRPYILIPSFRDARILARHRDRFEPLIQIAAPELESIEKISPKSAFARFTQEQGLAAPATRILAPEDREELNPEALDYPFIIKPDDGVGGRGIKMIGSSEELDTYLQEASEDETLLLQEPIDGRDYCVSVIANHGELEGIVVYRNEKQFPAKSGAGAIRITVDPQPFVETTRALLKATDWHGVCEIDFRWDETSTSEPKLIEVNPRYWAGLFHSTESGIDFPWLAYQLAAGKDIHEANPLQAEIGFKSKTPAAWVLSIAEDIAANDAHLKRTGEAWDEMKASIGKGEILSAARSLLESAEHSLSTPQMVSAIQSELKKHSDLPSEFSDDDDPAVGLGVLFALSSLVRHGELPPELKFEAPKKASDKTQDEQGIGYDADSAVDNETRPVIGITKPDNGDWFSYQAMKLAVWIAGGKPVKITSKAPRDPQSIDGLLFGGGSDVYPERYHGEVRAAYKYDLERDEMEASWAKAALDNNIPVLGICRGMQMLNVSQGGSLYADLSNYKDESYPKSFLRRIFYRKPIRIEPDSWLSKAARRKVTSVNSIHTQAVKELGRDFVVTAKEPNGLVQAIEHTASHFMVGLQFHPEFLIYRRFARQIFKNFVEAAKRCRTLRKAQRSDA